jgi:hypothetical protein
MAAGPATGRWRGCACWKRASAFFAKEWLLMQAQAMRIVPVVQQVLRTLAEAKNAA